MCIPVQLVSCQVLRLQIIAGSGTIRFLIYLSKDIGGGVGD